MEQYSGCELETWDLQGDALEFNTLSLSNWWFTCYTSDLCHRLPTV